MLVPIKLTNDEYKRFIAIQSRKAVNNGVRVIDIPCKSGKRIDIRLDFEPTVDKLNQIRNEDLSDVLFNICNQQCTFDELVKFLQEN